LHESFWPSTHEQARQPTKGSPFRRPDQQARRRRHGADQVHLLTLREVA
jgi:hypothetical protein